MSEESGQIISLGSVVMEFTTDFQSRRISFKEVVFRTADQGGREWVEVSSESGMHHGYGRSMEAALLSLMARVMDVDREDIG